MRFPEEILPCPQPNSRALEMSPRYEIRHKASRIRGALSYFNPVLEPPAQGSIGGLLAKYGSRRARPLVPVSAGRHLLGLGKIRSIASTV